MLILKAFSVLLVFMTGDLLLYLESYKKLSDIYLKNITYDRQSRKFGLSGMPKVNDFMNYRWLKPTVMGTTRSLGFSPTPHLAGSKSKEWGTKVPGKKGRSFSRRLKPTLTYRNSNIVKYFVITFQIVTLIKTLQPRCYSDFKEQNFIFNGR